MTTPITEVTTKVHTLLEPLTPEERLRVVKAVLTLLGVDISIRTPSAMSEKIDSSEEEGADTTNLPSKANAWIKKHGLTLEQLEHFFHFDNGNVTCIELAGNGQGKREKTIHTYLMLGVAALLGKGEPEFTDDEAREKCTDFGCYDRANHTKTYDDFGNFLIGSKSSGWKLTTPGLATAAGLIKS